MFSEGELDEGHQQLKANELARNSFEVVSKRYEALKSIILTSNKSYGTWNEIFPDPVLATALLDRWLRYSSTINIRGETYRLQHRRQADSQPGKPWST